MDIGAGWTDLGLPGIFLASFLAATLLPLSSEVLLAAMALGPWSTAALWATASAGNTLGGLTNYGIGRWVPHDRLLKWTRMDPAKAARWERAVQRHGAWCALLCWLPVVGDPLALALGLFRAKPWPVAVLMFIGKAARYAVVLAVLRH
ncbi:MAG: YqaA family protein [Flavobacteriales bacterium]